MLFCRWPLTFALLSCFVTTGGTTLLSQELSPDGTPATRNLDATEPTRNFSFAVGKAGRYRIATSGTTQVQLDLFSAKDETPLDPTKHKGNRQSFDLVNQSIECELAAGSYRIRIQHAVPGGVGEFTVSLRKLDGVSESASADVTLVQSDSTATARLWLQTGHGPNQIRQVRFANGPSDLVLTSGVDATYLWQTATAREIRRFPPAETCDVTQDGRWVLTGSGQAATLSDGRTADSAWSEFYKNESATHVAWLHPDNSGNHRFLVVKAVGDENDPQQISEIHVRAVNDEGEVTSVAVANVPRVTCILPSEGEASKIWFGCRDGSIREFDWSANGGEPSLVADVGDNGLLTLGATPDFQSLFCVTDQTYELFRISLPPASVTKVANLADVGWRHPKLPGLEYRGFGFFPQAKHLLTADSDGVLRIWSTEDGSKRRILELARDSILAIGLSVDSSRLLIGDSGGNVSILPIGSGNLDRAADPVDAPQDFATNAVSLTGQSTVVNAIQFSDDGKRVLTALDDNTLRAWSLGSGGQETFKTEARVSVMSAEGSFVVSGHDWVKLHEEGMQPREFRLFPPPEKPQVGNALRSVTACAFAQGVNHLALISEHEIGLFDTACRTEIARRTLAQVLTTVALSPTGKWAAVGGSNSFSVLRVDENLPIVTEETVIDHVTAIRFSPTTESEDLAVATSGGEVTVWTSTGEQVYRKSLSSDATGKSLPVGVSDIAFTPDGKKLFCGCSDGVARLLDLHDESFVREFKGHSNSISAVAVSPQTESPQTDRRLVVTGSSDKTAIVWDLDTAQPLCSLVSLRSGGWFVLDEENRFDTDSLEKTPGVHWIFSDSPFNAGPPSLFQREYYEPALLARKIKGESFSPVGDITELNRAQPGVKIVEIKQDIDHADVVDICVQVEAGKLSVFRDEKELMMETRPYDLRLFRDGQLVGQFPPTDRESERTLHLSDEGDAEAWQMATDVFAHAEAGTDGKVWFRGVALPRRLREQTATFSAYAFNDQRVRSEIAELEYNVPKDLPDPKPVAYVLSVGVNTYETPAWNLQFAANDAVEFERILRSRLGEANEYEVVSIPLVSETGRHAKRLDATKENVRIILQQLGGTGYENEEFIGLPGDARRLKKATPDDVLIVFFAGHGFTAADGTFYFFPYDIGKNNIGLNDAVLRNAISSTELSQWLRDVDVGGAVMIIDACQSASIVRPPGFKIGPFGSRGLGQLAYDKGMQVLAASQSEQVAVEISDLGHGLLTYAIVKDGITDRKALDQDNSLTLTSCLEHAQKNVRRIYEALLAEAAADSADKTRLMRLNRSRDALIKVDSRLTDAELRDLRRFPVQEPALFDFQHGKMPIRLGKQPE